MSSAEMLTMPEPEFVARFSQLLAACPVVRDDDYVGASTARRSLATLEQARAQRARQDRENERMLAESRAHTARLEQSAREAQRKRETEEQAVEAATAAAMYSSNNSNNSNNGGGYDGNTVQHRWAGSSRASLAKSDSAVRAEVAVKAYYKRMQTLLNSSSSFSAQQAEMLVQRVKVLTEQYLSQLCLEDIDNIGKTF